MRDGDRDLRVVLITVGSREAGESLAESLVEERLAACGNVIPGVVSVYRWEGEMHRDPEALLILKTTSGCLSLLISRVRELHDYDVPEVLALPIVGGMEEYMEWVRQECGEATKGG